MDIMGIRLKSRRWRGGFGVVRRIVVNFVCWVVWIKCGVFEIGNRDLVIVIREVKNYVVICVGYNVGYVFGVFVGCGIGLMMVVLVMLLFSFFDGMVKLRLVMFCRGDLGFEMLLGDFFKDMCGLDLLM